MSRIVVLAIVACVVALASGCGTTKGGQSTAKPTPTASEASSGTYLVGTDIPAGRYTIQQVAGLNPSYTVSSDKEGKDVIASHAGWDMPPIGSEFPVLLEDGQYLAITDMVIVRSDITVESPSP